MTVRKNNAGAALIIAIAIMTILLAIALTFFSATRSGVTTATNVTNTVRVEHLSDGAMAIAIASLNEDYFHHPNVTSTDHAWRTLFNGSWVAGKSWAWRDGIPLQAGGVPYVDLNKMPRIYFRDTELEEPMYLGAKTRDWLYIPRWENNGPVIYAPRDNVQARPSDSSAQTPLSVQYYFDDSGAYPFVTSSYYGRVWPDGEAMSPFSAYEEYPAEQIARWTDVDNDDDGYNDSIWIPLAADIFMIGDRIDNDLDGLVDENQDDGIDYDGDGYAGIRADGMGEDPDEAIEAGVFVYARNDNGIIMSEDDYQLAGPITYFLTSPLPGLRIPLDIDADGIADIDENTGLPYIVQLPDTIYVNVRDEDGNESRIALTADAVDTEDNDLDLVVNSHFVYAYLGPDMGPGWRLPGNWRPEGSEGETEGEEDQALKSDYAVARQKAYHDINIDVVFGGPGNLTFPNGGPSDWSENKMRDCIRITHSGEPVCELVGRAAILINDEASKVNLNVAGALNYRPDFEPALGEGPLQRALNVGGGGPAEYETRMLPNVNLGYTAKLNGLRSGSPDKTPSGEAGQECAVLRLTQHEGEQEVTLSDSDGFRYDKSLPGYGRVDDNGNALLLGMNGLDDDGDGLIDEGMYLPPEDDPQYDTYLMQLGLLEGVDEPTEFQRYHALRNAIAERDGVDNDNDGVTDEAGELADRQLLNLAQYQPITTYPDPTTGEPRTRGLHLSHIATVHSHDTALNHMPTAKGMRALNKVDYNYASPQQIATQLILAGDLEPITAREFTYHDLDTDLYVPRKLVGNPIDPDYDPLPYPDSVARYDTNGFAMGLRQADTHVTAPEVPYATGGLLHSYWDGLEEDLVPAGDPVVPATRAGASSDQGVPPLQDGDVKIPAPDHAIPADPQLQALQTAVDLVDTSDINHARSEITLDRPEIDPDSPREVIPTENRLPLDQLQEYAKDVLNKSDKEFDNADHWWNKQPDGDSDNDNDEESDRYISYTAAGREAIRINELMVRPVRRVEAEATPDSVNHADYGVFYDPSPFTDTLFNADGTYASVTPEFLLAKSYVGLSPGWMPEPLSSQLGAETVWQSTNEDSYDPDYSEPNVLEYLFVDSTGLPAGRYYLTANLTNTDGDMTVWEDGQLKYAIKYVHVTIPLSGKIIQTDPNDPLNLTPPLPLPIASTRIIEDIQELNATLSTWSFLDTIFTPVLRDHLALPYTDARDNLGIPPGWAFIDGTPKDFEPYENLPNSIPLGSPGGGALPNQFRLQYYVDGGVYPVAADPDEKLLPAIDPYKPTHTVTVPSLTLDEATGVKYGYALCVALWNAKLNDGTGDITQDGEIAVNFFDFSQEPDHEYVELVNTSDAEVDLSGWELEIGAPGQGDVEDPFKSVWQVPDNTFIAPKGMLLLSFETIDPAKLPPNSGTGFDWGKFDMYRMANSPSNLTSVNGIGLACSTYASEDFPPVPGVTVPPIVDGSHDVYADPSVESDLLADRTGSVFEREALWGRLYDYVDRDGDGVSSYRMALEEDRGSAAQERVDTDRSMVEENVTSTAGGDPNRPWDRIVSMKCVRLWKGEKGDTLPESDTPWNPKAAVTTLYDITDVDDLAHLILKGGVLPNYPEHDGIDNDGDGGFLQYDAEGTLSGDPTFKYIPGVLDKDGVDNDLDDSIDERGRGFVPLYWDDTYFDEENGNDFWDNGSDVAYPNRENPGDPYTSEGVDEGFCVGRRYGYGSFEEGGLPLYYFKNIEFYGEAWNNPDNGLWQGIDNNGWPLPSEVDWQMNGGKWIPAEGMRADRLDSLGAFDGFDFNIYFDIESDDRPYLRRLYSDDAPFIGSDYEPPEWKAFVERRWNPGDCVVVTLYVGSASLNRVADRVTYRELDVTNRTVDDVVACPYPENLNPDYPTMWPPNQMGLDFYRSLERKHPLATGDRFGTQNRWQATDGNYDDWAESPSFYVRDVDFTTFPYQSIAAPVARFSSARQEQLYRHAMYGSPLRMNLAQRLAEHPADLKLSEDERPLSRARADMDILLQFDWPDWPQTDYVWQRVIAGAPKKRHNMSWAFDRAVMRDAPLETPGDVLLLAQLCREEVLMPHRGWSSTLPPILVNALGVNDQVTIYRVSDGKYCQPYIAGGAVSYVGDLGLRGALLGQDTLTREGWTPDMRARVLDSMALNPLVLTVGQATFHPIWPNPNPDSDAGMMKSTEYPEDETDLASMLTWHALGGGSQLKVSTAWTPVHLFWMDGTDNVSGRSRYPRFMDGYDAGVLMNLQGLFNWDELAALDMPISGGQIATGGKNDGDVRLTWPLSKRAVMYCARQRRVLGGGTPPPDYLQVQSEALFVWDAEDGLENGEYVLHIGTFLPGLSQRIERMAGENGVPEGKIRLTDFAKDTFMALDPTGKNANGSGQQFAPQLAIEVITDRVKAQGMKPSRDQILDAGLSLEVLQQAQGMTHPRDWKPQVMYTADSDGYIFYGAGAHQAWRPQIVHVEDNFLAIRVRNMTPEPGVATISHVVLSPRRRQPGKINVNTAENRLVEVSGSPNRSVFNALLGLPGVVQGWVNRPDYVGFEELDRDFGLEHKPIAAMWQDGQGKQHWPRPNALIDEPEDSEYNVPPVWVDPEENNPEWPLGPELSTNTDRDDDGISEDVRAATQVSAMILDRRPEHVDGRYYRNLNELLGDVFAGGEDLSAQPLTNNSSLNEYGARFDEMMARFSRMANLITTRSDVFEIIATVQAGYGVDADNSGWINYRSPDEFVTTAETKGRMVYERRSAKDRSDTPVE